MQKLFVSFGFVLIVSFSLFSISTSASAVPIYEYHGFAGASVEPDTLGLFDHNASMTVQTNYLGWELVDLDFSAQFFNNTINTYPMTITVGGIQHHFDIPPGDPHTLFDINVSTSAMQSNGQVSFNFELLAGEGPITVYSAVVGGLERRLIPEPGTIFLFLIAGLGMIAVKKNKKRNILAYSL